NGLAIVKAIYELLVERRTIKNVVVKQALFVTYSLMATKGGRTQKRQLIVTKNIKLPHFSKHQTTTGESLKKSIAVDPISFIKIIDVEEQAEEESGFIKRKWKNAVAEKGASEGKAQNFMVERSDEIGSIIIEMLPIEVQVNLLQILD
ncbi:Hypothetical predicted protein, partial [Olea europaea subsp. europaea]